jgi:hypothetical protein
LASDRRAGRRSWTYYAFTDGPAGPVLTWGVLMKGSRTFILALVATFALVVAACGGGSNETAEGNTSQGGSAESGSGSSETNRELGNVEVGSFSGSLEDCMALSVSVASVGLLGVAETFGDATGLTGADIDEAERALSEMEANPRRTRVAVQHHPRRVCQRCVLRRSRG